MSISHAFDTPTSADLDWVAELTRQEREGIDRSILPERNGTEKDYDGPVSEEIAAETAVISARLRRP